MLNVAILHSHFCRGGVTQVAENHVAALADTDDLRIALVSGGRDEGLSESTRAKATTIHVPLIDYDVVIAPDRSVRSEDSRSLLDRVAATTESLVAALKKQGFGAENTLLHWHNHSLGKNVAVPAVVRRLATEFGFRQLLQIHDFAEDFRPENYLKLATAARLQSDRTETFQPADVNRYLYPTSATIHYATLTSGDASLLSQVGIGEQRRHVLPNSVDLGSVGETDRETALRRIADAASLPEGARWCVYPVRGIRRKNVGEFLLLSQWFPENLYAGITLPPATQIERASYERWRDIAAEVAPRCVFDAGTFDGVTFLDNLIGSQFILSSSVAEGFGMAFLEPWLVRRGVIARRLPDVVSDFEAAGMDLDRFYDGLWIPADGAWIDQCRRETAQALHQAWHAVTGELGAAFRVDGERSGGGEQEVDFATLTPRRQIDVLRRIRSDVGFAAEVAQRNRAVADHFATGFDDSLLDLNQSVVASEYSLSQGGRRLMDIYRRVAAADPPANFDAEKRTNNAADVSLAQIIANRRTYYPCRTETEIVS